MSFSTSLRLAGKGGGDCVRPLPSFDETTSSQVMGMCHSSGSICESAAVGLQLYLRVNRRLRNTLYRGSFGTRIPFNIRSTAFSEDVDGFEHQQTFPRSSTVVVYRVTCSESSDLLPFSTRTATCTSRYCIHTTAHVGVRTHSRVPWCGCIGVAHLPAGVEPTFLSRFPQSDGRLDIHAARYSYIASECLCWLGIRQPRIFISL